MKPILTNFLNWSIIITLLIKTNNFIMDKDINYKLSFKRFLFKNKEGRIALLLNITLPYLSVDKSEQPELDFFINILLFFIFITLPIYFYAKWKREKKFKKGEALYPFGYEINSETFSNLYDYGKKIKRI